MVVQRCGSSHAALLLVLLVSPQLLHLTAAKLAQARSAYPLAPAQPGSSSTAAGWPGAYSGGPEATIWRRPVVLALGDSITQMGSNEYDNHPGWLLRLAAHYNRKADVINRGFGGFNTKTAVLALPEILDMLSQQQVALALVWLGANDAALLEGADGRAHIPVEQYSANLAAIVQRLLSAGVERVLVVTPPPVLETAPQAIPPGHSIAPRNFKTTEQYAEAARKVAAAAGSSKVSLLDAFQAFVGSGSDWGSKLLGPDGLHLSKAGNDFMYDQVWNALNAAQLTSINLPIHHPDWWFIDFPSADKQFAAEQAAYRSVFKGRA